MLLTVKRPLLHLEWESRSLKKAKRGSRLIRIRSIESKDNIPRELQQIYRKALTDLSSQEDYRGCSGIAESLRAKIQSDYAYASRLKPFAQVTKDNTSNFVALL